MKESNDVPPFPIPTNYDWYKSTNYNYKNDDVTEFVGDFIDIRKTRDYKYHVRLFLPLCVTLYPE